MVFHITLAAVAAGVSVDLNDLHWMKKSLPSSEDIIHSYSYSPLVGTPDVPPQDHSEHLHSSALPIHS